MPRSVKGSCAGCRERDNHTSSRTAALRSRLRVTFSPRLSPRGSRPESPERPRDIRRTARPRRAHRSIRPSAAPSPRPRRCCRTDPRAGPRAQHEGPVPQTDTPLTTVAQFRRHGADGPGRRRLERGAVADRAARSAITGSPADPPPRPAATPTASDCRPREHPRVPSIGPRPASLDHRDPDRSGEHAWTSASATHAWVRSRPSAPPSSNHRTFVDVEIPASRATSARDSARRPTTSIRADVEAARTAKPRAPRRWSRSSDHDNDQASATTGPPAASPQRGAKVQVANEMHLRFETDAERARDDDPGLRDELDDVGGARPLGGNDEVRVLRRDRGAADATDPCRRPPRSTGRRDLRAGS